MSSFSIFIVNSNHSIFSWVVIIFNVIKLVDLYWSKLFIGNQDVKK